MKLTTTFKPEKTWVIIIRRAAGIGFLLVIFLLLGGTTEINFGGVILDDSLIIDGPQNRETFAYTPHDWISIIGNDEFLAQAALEGWPGQGTEENPIIIEGYSFAESRHLFRAINCDVYFEFRNNLLNGIDQSWCGFYMSNAANARVYNNTIINSAIPFHVINLNDSIFEDNHLYNNGNMAFGFEMTCVGNVIRENIVHNNFGGLWLDWNSTDNLVIDNQFYDNVGDGVVVLTDARNNFIINNTITGHTLNGIMSRGYDNTFMGNLISNNMQNGILLAEEGGHNISNNVIQDNGRCGVSIYSFSHTNHENTLIHNSFLDNGLHGVKIGIGCNRNTVKWNNFIANGETLQAKDLGDDNVFKYNYWNPWNGTDENGDTYADFPYSLEGSDSNTDDFPLMNPTDQLPLTYEYTPNSPATVITTTDSTTNTTESNPLDFPVVELTLAASSAIAVILVAGIFMKKRRIAL